MSEARPTLDIIIVNWNAGQQLRDCLDSIAANLGSDVSLIRVVIVDNASRDASCEGLHNHSLPLLIQRNQENRGFATACNQGAAGSTADFLLFLNPDARLSNNSLAPLELLRTAANRRIGICGAQLIDDSGNVSRSCVRFPRPVDFVSTALGLDRGPTSRFPGFAMKDWDHQSTMVVDHIIGAFYLVRRHVFTELNGFDERFFVYLEDLDFSLRARQLGWLSLYVADAQAHHRGGGTSSQIPATRLFFALRSRILYGFKHFSWWEATGVAAVTLVLEPFARVGLAIAEGSPKRAITTVLAFGRLWADIPLIAARQLRRTPR